MFQRIVIATGNGGTSVEDAAKAVARRSPAASMDRFHLHPERPGDLLDELLAHTADTNADLLVLGARRHVIASRAAMLAPASVLMVPDGATLDLSHIAVPVDFSGASEHALRCAVDLAGSNGKITAISVECDDEPWLEWASDHGRVQQHLVEFVEQHVPGSGVSCAVEPLSHSVTALPVDGMSLARRIEGADVATTLLAAVQRLGASVIVMGTRGRTRSASILLGSVTEQVMQRATCPVLALRHSHAPLGLVDAVLSRLAEPSTAITAN